MRKEDFEFYKGKKIKVVLKNTYHYTGKIKKINEETIILLDKFNKIITISIPDISQIEETGDGLERKKD